MDPTFLHLLVIVLLTASRVYTKTWMFTVMVNLKMNAYRCWWDKSFGSDRSASSGPRTGRPTTLSIHAKRPQTLLRQMVQRYTRGNKRKLLELNYKRDCLCAFQAPMNFSELCLMLLVQFESSPCLNSRSR